MNKLSEKDMQYLKDNFDSEDILMINMLTELFNEICIPQYTGSFYKVDLKDVLEPADGAPMDDMTRMNFERIIKQTYIVDKKGEVYGPLFGSILSGCEPLKYKINPRIGTNNQSHTSLVYKNKANTTSWELYRFE